MEALIKFGDFVELNAFLITRVTTAQYFSIINSISPFYLWPLTAHFAVSMISFSASIGISVL